MLNELRIQNLLLIEEARLELASGLNVLTGETGAGKTLLATALGLLLGERSRNGLVRPGADEAYVEGVFDSIPELPADLADVVEAGAGEVVLARRIWQDGRSRALINGRTATVSDLRRLGSVLLSFHGQHEHRKLALSAFQLDAVDKAAGAPQALLRERALDLHHQARAATEHLASLAGDDGSAQREVDLLRFEVAEIDAVADDLVQVDALKEERGKLRSVDALRSALQGLAALAGDGTGGEAPTDAVAGVLRGFDAIAGVDSAIDELGARAASVSIELSELTREAAYLSDSLDGSPERLQEIEERLSAVDRLVLKHGGSIEKVLEHSQSASKRLAELEDLDGAVERARDELGRVQREQETVAGKLRSGRLEVARRLGPAVEAQLEELALEGARFEIVVEAQAEAGPTGADSVEFRVSANPGLPLAPISDVASGGEMSRILLALLSLPPEEGGDQTGNLVVFDEIDAGIGGVTAKAVGTRLKALSSQRQVLCITHLPQVASCADRHFRLSKVVGKTDVVTRVDALAGVELEREMVRMLGGTDGDEAALAHARELLAEG